ncbi:MAG: hypothetical protein KAR25_01590 [Methanosarcinales archaeon]|nr:hypothetical protein [Methanosarcinales archaeon]
MAERQIEADVKPMSAHGRRVDGVFGCGIADHVRDMINLAAMSRSKYMKLSVD